MTDPANPIDSSATSEIPGADTSTNPPPAPPPPPPPPAPTQSEAAAEQSQDKPAVEIPELTSKPITVGRILHVYMPHQFAGPRPAIVARVSTDPGFAAVNIFVDGFEDSAFLKTLRDKPAGNTYVVTVYDPLTEEQRKAVAAEDVYWAEWMPFQAAQSQLQEKAADNLARFTEFAQTIRDELRANTAAATNAPSTDGPQHETRLATCETAIVEIREQIGQLLRDARNRGVLA